MKVNELVELLRFCGDENTVCTGCRRFDYRCGDWKCAAELLVMAADALDARNAGDALIPAWMPVKFSLPPMETEVVEDEEDTIEFQRSQPVLGYTTYEQMVVVTAYVEEGKLWWCDDGGEEYQVTHWMPIKKKERK